MIVSLAELLQISQKARRNLGKQLEEKPGTTSSYEITCLCANVRRIPKLKTLDMKHDTKFAVIEGVRNRTVESFSCLPVCLLACWLITFGASLQETIIQQSGSN
jgi:hypothetical protein